MLNEIELENLLNKLIEKATANGGHVYVVDKKNNSFALRLTEPIRIQFYGGFNGDD